MGNTPKLKKYNEDEIIVMEGQITFEMYKILSGKVAAYINYGEANECLLGIFDEHRTFGESGMLCERPCMYTVVALEETLVMRVSIDEFDEFINNNTQNARNVIRNLAREVAVMRCNMDLMMDEFEHNSEAERMSIRELKEKLSKSAASDWKNCTLLDKWSETIRIRNGE